MMDEKQFEAEYRKLQHQATPDLWERIEENLKEHPERDLTKKPVLPKKPPVVWTLLHNIPPFEMTAVIAAMLVLMVIVPQLTRQEPTLPSLETDSASLNTNNQSRPLPNGVITVSQLNLPTPDPLPVPENAKTLPEDTLYFSEGILSDTQLLVSGTIETAALEYDAAQRAVMVVYEMTLDQIYFSDDYLSGASQITVKSPIVETQGDEAYILYQLQPGGTYLLPLTKEEEDWKLLYPFAPQIQVTKNGGYLFHSGYTSLVNEHTTIIIGSQEGPNDYYYDRMLLREDDRFPYELTALITP